jgi:hypothetical protein
MGRPGAIAVGPAVDKSVRVCVAFGPEIDHAGFVGPIGLASAPRYNHLSMGWSRKTTSVALAYVFPVL